jgi:hypothetical protein
MTVSHAAEDAILGGERRTDGLWVHRGKLSVGLPDLSAPAPFRAGDLGVSRGDGTGVVYFGGRNDRYIYFDGTSFRFAGGTVKTSPDAGWLQPVFQNSWVNYFNSYDFGYRKMPDGTVRMRGLIGGGGQSTVAFTLPAGYRPSSGEVFLAAGVSGVYRNDIANDGQVRIGVEIKAGTWANTWVSMSNISFLAEV